MRYSSRQSKKRGFLLLLPIILVSAAALYSFSLLFYKADHLGYALSRYEAYLIKKYEQISLKNKAILYRTFDPGFD